jgi:AcrR family transcriptional regulator
MNDKPRAYSMAKRAAQAAMTRERIRQTAIALYKEKPEDFSLKGVAAAAQTTVQTVLRLFGSKAALIVLANEAGMPDRRHGARSRGEIAIALRKLQDAYEQRGDGTASAGEAERAAQRAWVERHLLPESPAAEPALLFALMVAIDPSTWKLLRQDLGLYRRAAEAVVIEMIDALMGG